MKVLLRLAVFAVVLAGCGASSAELKRAREARYQGDLATLRAAAMDAVQRDYDVAQVDQSETAFRTEGRWYNPEGQLDTTKGNNLSRLQDNSINLVFWIRFEPAAGGTFRVRIDPNVLRHHPTSSAPERLSLDDPTLPGWVRGKLDALVVDIASALKAHAVGGAAAPAAPAAPASAPAPEPAPPAAAPEPAPPAPPASGP